MVAIFIRASKVLFPGCFLVGMGIEAYFIKSGYFENERNKEADRRMEFNMDLINKQRRLKEIGIDIPLYLDDEVKDK